MGEPTDELTLEIMRSLEMNLEWRRSFDPTDVDGIAEARRSCRRAGRALGFRIATHQSDPALREDGRVVVSVVVTQGMDPETMARLEKRALLLMNDFHRRHFEQPHDPGS
ncbi:MULTISPECIES: hypothetical protein [unclassified Nocardia]|uniref:hypothetical protein n=1 Tax=unclassified Nocardia TaxID=2637762 RepID=UPI001CE4478E|nr:MULTISPECIES: hypothetical protein [unclassified Nocardia]